MSDIENILLPLEVCPICGCEEEGCHNRIFDCEAGTITDNCDCCFGEA